MLRHIFRSMKLIFSKEVDISIKHRIVEELSLNKRKI